MPVTKIRSHWSGGDLIFHEALSVRPADLYNVLTVGDDAVTVGSATNDINFSWLGTTTGTFVLDAGAHTLVTTGLDWTITGDIGLTGNITVDVGDVQIGDNDYLMFGDGTGGDVSARWVSTTSLLEWLPLTDATGAFVIGNGTKNIDFKVWGGSGAGYYLLYDESEDDLILAGVNSQLELESTVNSTTTATGSIHTLGGLGVALNSFLGGTLSVGTISAIDAAGPSIVNEAATTTNPTLIPNRADATTGIGWNTAELHFVISGVDEVNLSATALSPGVTDSTALGTTALMWSDLFLASAGVINFDNGNVTITHSAALLTLGSGGLSIGASGAGFDVIFYGDTADCNLLWDQNLDTNGGLQLGADTKATYFYAYGATTGNYLKWDAANDDLLLAGTGTQLAVAGTTASTTTTTGSLRTAGGLGVVGAAFIGGNVSASKVLTLSNLGTVNTGVTAVEYGDGYSHVTVLTVSQVDALTLADLASIADGYLLYTFPAGVVVIDYTYMTMGVTAGSAQLQSDTPDVGLGTVIGTGAVALLNGTATFEDILTGQTALADGTAEVKTLGPTAAIPLVIESGDAHTLHFNVADSWADDTSADLTADIAGTVVVAWRFLA